jgi:hypothetical protein
MRPPARLALRSTAPRRPPKRAAPTGAQSQSDRSVDWSAGRPRRRRSPLKRIAIAIASALVALLALLAGAQPAGASASGYSWKHVAGHWPVVYVQNQTDGHWSITKAVKSWGPGLRIGPCRAGAGCIRITSPARGKAAPLGQSFIYAIGKTITRVDIQLNRSNERQPAAVRKVAAQHELGHALGLGHNRLYRGVMGPVAWGHDRINTYERRALARIYGI